MPDSGGSQVKITGAMPVFDAADVTWSNDLDIRNVLGWAISAVGPDGTYHEVSSSDMSAGAAASLHVSFGAGGFVLDDPEDSP